MGAMQLDDVLVLDGGLLNALEDRGLDLKRKGDAGAKLMARFLDPPLRQ